MAAQTIAFNRQEELNRIIKSMAECAELDETQMWDTINKLSEIYAGDFRHSYSEFFPLLLGIAGDEGKYSLDFLMNNLLMLGRYIDEDSDLEEVVKSKMQKLCDHLHLEIAHMNYYAINYNKRNDTAATLLAAQTALNQVNESLEKAETKISSLQTEFVAILSIFAAIVITFSASTNFISSAMSAITSTPLLYSLLMVLVCGWILINAIFMLLYIVGKMTQRNIYARCKTHDCSCSNNGTPICNGITRIRKRMPYAFWINVLLLATITGVVVIWILGSLEILHFASGIIPQ